jgi:hypothetical protein
LYIKKIIQHIKNIWRKLFTDVHHKYRLALRDESFKEVFSFRLSRFNVIIGGSIALFLIVSTTILLIAFTPLKQLIPGYTQHRFVTMSYQNRTRLDSLSNIVEAQGLMLQVMQDVVEGKISADVAATIKDTLKDYSKITYRISLQDSLLRDKIEAAAAMTNSIEAGTEAKTKAVKTKETAQPTTQ